MPHRDFHDYEWNEHYRTQYGTSGHPFGYYEPGYRYGYDLAHEEHYRGRPWSTFEPDVRRDWEMRYPGKAWDDVKDAVRHAWENVKDTLGMD